ncbi:MAG: cytochrome c biogenesis protein CcsA [Burkholderiaceae bacterium]
MSILLVVAYLLPVVLYGRAWRLAAGSPGDAPSSQQVGSGWQLAGLVAHLASLYFAFLPHGVAHIGFAPIMSAALWVGVGLLWFEGLRSHVRALRVLILPVAMLAVVLPWAFPGGNLSDHGGGPMFVPHILVGTLAYAVLLIAAAHAGLMASAERALHGRGAPSSSMPARFLDELPPLLVLERLLFRLIMIGWALLTLTLVSGFIFSEEIFGRAFRFEHKTLLALVAWAVFSTLLLGRRLRGWRGRIALRMTFSGFLVLLLAYAGTRFVLEVVLGRF